VTRPTDWPEHWPSDEAMLERAVKIARRYGAKRRHPRWTAVVDALAVGSSVARAMCERFGLDPDEMVP
jgi:hypothetical protein